MSDASKIAIVGAGPYGLSIAAHLAMAGVGARVFGRPMQTWRENVPNDMLLKSDGFASSLSAPAAAFTLGRYCRERGISYTDVGWPVPVGVFADYGEEFARRFVPHKDGRRVTHLSRVGASFGVSLDDGDVVTVDRVILATGISAFARVPNELAGLPPSALSHSGRHADYSGFAGRSVAVIGAGASALDAAAALHRCGASVTLVSRRSALKFRDGRRRRAVGAALSPRTPLGQGWKKWLCCEAPLLFHALPERLRLHIVRRYLGPSPARFVRDAIEGRILLCLDSLVTGADLGPDGRVVLAVERKGGARDTLTVEHVVAGTGYKVEVGRLDFLDSALLPAIRTVDGSPVLSRSFESSVPGLHFVGTPSAYSFGPMFRFACGADYTAKRVTRHLLAAERARRSAADRADVPTLRPRASRP